MSGKPLDIAQQVTIAVLYRGDPNDINNDNMNRTKNMRISAPLPETFSISNGNQLDQTFSWFQIKDTLLRYSAVLSGGYVGSVNRSYARGLAERQFWSGPDNSEFSFDMEFVAYKSGLEDVVKPTKNLLLMSAAQERGLKSDNGADLGIYSSIGSWWDAPPLVHVRFGRVLTLPRVWIKNVNVSYSNKLDDHFQPLSATATVVVVPRDPYGANAYNKDIFYFTPES